MTKRWSSTRSDPLQTKRQASKRARVWHGDVLRYAEILERNGALRYVEFENGDRDYVSDFDVQAVIE